MKKIIRAYVVFLKEDLKIADTCKSVKEGLLTSIINKNHFSEELAAYFNRANPNAPFEINPADPTQVAVIKKVINALENTERSFRGIENIDISHDRYTAMVVKDVVKVSYQAIHEMYAALQLINHSNSDIQDIVGPHLKKILPQIALASRALGEFSPDQPEESAGAVLAGVVNMLPSKKQTEPESLGNLSNLIYKLPLYFEELQKLIGTGASGIANKSIRSTEEYQAALIKNANKTKIYFEDLSSSNRLTALPAYLKIFNKLVTHSTDVLNAKAPLTKQAYLEAVAILEDIKHNLLPQLVSELETVEESMGLKPGLLTDPALEKMNKYYTYLADQVDNIAKTAGVIDSISEFSDTTLGKAVHLLFGDNKKIETGSKLSPAPDINILMDDIFIEKRRIQQVYRLNEARFGSEAKNMASAANRFFDIIGSYNRIHQALSKWSLANIGQSEKNTLIREYKVFQLHFAALYPDIDKLIVDALTRPTGDTVVSRLYQSDYKQLWSSDHFKQVLSCKASVLSSIQQSASQSVFKAKLIEKTMSHSEETAYLMNHEATHLPYQVRIFEPLGFTLEDDKPAEYYHQQVLAVSRQISELERAQKGVTAFFNYIQEKYPSNPASLSLNEADKEYLRKAYKEFQPQVLALGEDDINNVIVRSLTTTKPNVHLFRDIDFVSVKDTINDYINVQTDNLKKDRRTYLDKEAEAREEQQTKKPLIPRGTEFEKKTLFGQMSELKLSKSVDQFFNNNFQTYLKNNLSQEVWKQLSSNGNTLDVDKIPFQDFHKDSPKTAMYKQLINALHHLKNGLEKLESLNDYKDSTNVYQRTRFIMTTFNALVMNISLSNYYVRQAGSNPGLQAIIQEGLDLLKPLEAMPFIGDYFKVTEKQAPPRQDIITAWRTQQSIASGSASSVNKSSMINNDSDRDLPIDQSISPEAKSSNTDYYIHLIAENLYQIPGRLKSLKEDPGTPEPSQTEINENIQALVKDFDKLSFGPGSVKKILRATTKLQMQLSEIGKEGRELILGRLKKIQAEYATVLLEAADNAEFNSGLKPGTYSSSVKNKFDKFYSSLIANMPLEKDQTGLELIIDTTNTQKRLAREMKRFKKIKADTSSIDAKKNIFGAEHEQFNLLYLPFDHLKQISEDIEHEIYLNMYERTLGELKELAMGEYNKIQPYLVQVNSEFTEDYIDNANDQSSLLKTIGRILAERHKINNPSSPFDKLRDLNLEDDFEKEENKENFLKIYAELQPYLAKINSQYNLIRFLRKLQTPEDFKAAIEKIINNESQLQELIIGLDNTKRLDRKISEERITYLRDLLNQQKLENNPEKIEAFKDKIFSNYLYGNVLSAMEVDIGSHAEQFVKFIDQDFLSKKTEIFEKITIEEDMEEEIAKAIDNIASDIDNNKKDSFKEFLFDNYIQVDINNSLKEVLGIYTDLLINTINKEINPYKSKILGNISFDSKMGAEIEEQIDKRIPQIVLSYNALRETYSELNFMLTKIDTSLDEESKKAGNNPCRKEKIAKLNVLRESLEDLESIANLESKDAFIFMKNKKDELESLESHDALISMYEVLNSLSETIEKNDPDKTKDDKQQMISDIKSILSNTDKNAAERLNMAVSMLSYSNPEILSKSKNVFLIGEAFKEQAFTNYVTTEIKEQFNNEYGPFGKVFLRQILPDFIAKQSQIMNEIAFDNIKNEIDFQFKIHVAAVYENNKDLKAGYEQLHANLTEVQLLLQTEENKPKDNPCRKEKIKFLKSHQTRFMNTDSIPDNEVHKFLPEQMNSSKIVFEKLDKFDTMISLYDSLIQIKNYVNNHKSYLNDIKTEKLQEISEMESLLTDNKKEPSTRLATVKARFNEQCEKVLLKNSDNFLIKFIKSLASKFFNIHTEKETLVSSLKQRLHNIKGPARMPRDTSEKELLSENEPGPKM